MMMGYMPPMMYDPSSNQFLPMPYYMPAEGFEGMVGLDGLPAAGFNDNTIPQVMPDGGMTGEVPAPIQLGGAQEAGHNYSGVKPSSLMQEAVAPSPARDPSPDSTFPPEVPEEEKPLEWKLMQIRKDSSDECKLETKKFNWGDDGKD